MSVEKKLPGKSDFSGRRRGSTRKSGFKSADGVTGGEFEHESIGAWKINTASSLTVRFSIPQATGKLSGFGLWFACPSDVRVTFVSTLDPSKITFEQFDLPDWSKLGSIWEGRSNSAIDVEVTFKTKRKRDTAVALYGIQCGVLEHNYLDDALIHRPRLLNNIHQLSPEALFISDAGSFAIEGETFDAAVIVTRKSCNRCARFLPINTHNERASLSFSNHCVAAHRRPCSHSGFGKLRDTKDGTVLQLDFGFQLECRFCKKFEVNAALNPKRTAGQMKEDGQRRRSLEDLLAELFGASAQLAFRHSHNGIELSDYIWEKFDRKCFNCEAPIASAKVMHLDHTRPLALMWPLDETATCLCSSCNPQKRDRSPSEFYSRDQITHLARLTGIPEDDLLTPGPNQLAIRLLIEKFDWFFDVFLKKPALTKERDGKTAAELLVKAIQKVFDSSAGNLPNIQKEFRRRMD
jgi:hypothetical protein